MKFLLDDAPELGIRQFAVLDEGDEKNSVGVTIITESTNIKAALDANAQCRAQNERGFHRGTQTWGHHAASIPVGVWEQFCRECPELRFGTLDSHAWLMAKLNSSEYCHLKTYGGTV